MSDYLERTKTGTVFVGSDVRIFQALAIAQGLKLYARTGMRINRAYTPKNMMAVAAQLTGQRFKARDYLGAAQALSDWADARKAAPRDDEARAVGLPAQHEAGDCTTCGPACVCACHEQKED
jgi:hypothetical protein